MCIRDRENEEIKKELSITRESARNLQEELAKKAEIEQSINEKIQLTESLYEEKAVLEQENKDLKVNYEKLLIELEESKKALPLLQKAVDEANTKISEIEKKEQEIKQQFAEREKILLEQIHKLEIAAGEHEKIRSGKLEDELSKKIQLLTEQFKEAEREWNEQLRLEKERSIQLQGEIEKMKEKVPTVSGAVDQNALKEDSSKLIGEIEELKKRIEFLQQDRDNSTQLLEAAQKEIAAKNNELKRLQDSMTAREEGLTTRIEQFRKDIMEYAAVVDSLKQQIRQKDEEIAKLRDSIKSLQQAPSLQPAQQTGSEDSAKKLVRQKEEILQEIKREIEVGKKWFVKLDDGKEYGPVQFATLAEWACDGRIGPDHEISNDRQAWQPAKNIKMMQMEWFVSLVDGSLFGPLPLPAIKNFVEQGVVDRNGKAANKNTGETISIEKLNDAAFYSICEKCFKANIELELLNMKLAEEHNRIRLLEEKLTKFAEDSGAGGFLPPKAIVNVLSPRQ